METIKVQGMSCQHCVMSVAKALGKIPGLENVKVNLDRGEATFENTRNASPATIRKAIEEAGYEVAD